MQLHCYITFIVFILYGICLNSWVPKAAFPPTLGFRGSLTQPAMKPLIQSHQMRDLISILNYTNEDTENTYRYFFQTCTLPYEELKVTALLKERKKIIN